MIGRQHALMVQCCHRCIDQGLMDAIGPGKV